MSDVLEKAAEALADHFGCEWETMRDADREMIRGYVRAVLTAVKDQGCALAMWEACYVDGDQMLPDFCLTAMIDAILGGPEV